MPILASADWLILLIYGFFVLSAGFSLAPAITGSQDYLQAGRKLPGWLCGLALAGASMGSLEVLGMGAAGARFGVASIGFFALGSIPAMLFAALVLMPVFYGAASAAGTPVRSIPEYLGAALRPENAGAQCRVVFGHGAVQRRDFAVRHGAHRGCAARLR